MTIATPADHFVRQMWAALNGDEHAVDAVTFTGAGSLLPSVYDVTGFAAASVAAASLAVAEFHAARYAQPLRSVSVDRRHAAAAFRSERYLSAQGWELPQIWDPIAGDYPTRDGWIRLHTNYAYHRDAVVRVLGVAAERQLVAAAVAEWRADDLETAVVAAGGCAAMMRSREGWQTHPQGQALRDEPLVSITTEHAPTPRLPTADNPLNAAPLDKIRVLDLTRVIAGPVCTRVLAAYGADVLRIDPPGFAEVQALLGDTTAGKRCAALDLRDPANRATFEHLVTNAHVIVHGYRGDAMRTLGFTAEHLRTLNPTLLMVSHDAYGWTGPWAARRGFDSLVQMSCGIAARGREVFGSERPHPLPAQALDHGTGYLLAAITCRLLTDLLRTGRVGQARLSLARTADHLMDQGETGDPTATDFTADDAAAWLEEASTAFGGIKRVRCPGRIAGITAQWIREAGPLGRDAPGWS